MIFSCLFFLYLLFCVWWFCAERICWKVVVNYWVQSFEDVKKKKYMIPTISTLFSIQFQFHGILKNIEQPEKDSFSCHWSHLLIKRLIRISPAMSICMHTLVVDELFFSLPHAGTSPQNKTIFNGCSSFFFLRCPSFSSLFLLCYWFFLFYYFDNIIRAQ